MSNKTIDIPHGSKRERTRSKIEGAVRIRVKQNRTGTKISLPKYRLKSRYDPLPSTIILIEWFLDWKSLFYSILRVFLPLQTRFLFLDGVGDGQKFEYMVQKWFDSSTLWGGVTVPCYLYLVCRFFCTIFGESAKAWGEKADTTFQAFVDWKMIGLGIWEDPEKGEFDKGT